ncbi:MAG TPA: hypothetical protein VJ815_01200, partial [Acidimicrobiia bacterium]|nr:hypothetical protein [Acidimicrobiia bacterium]
MARKNESAIRGEEESPVPNFNLLGTIGVMRPGESNHQRLSAKVGEFVGRKIPVSEVKVGSASLAIDQPPQPDLGQS